MPSRARARDAVKRGTVFVNGEPARKASQTIFSTDELILEDPASRYVSRAALKLVAALDHFGFPVKDKHVLDLGASTGGFCQVLLERHAAGVCGIDVGHGQLDKHLVGHPRLTYLEGINARVLRADQIPFIPDAIVTDVSFISLRLALPPALTMIKPGGWGIFLIKPQFEVGKENIGGGGLVRDAGLGHTTAKNIAIWVGSQPGWKICDLLPCPLTGGDGNQEYLLGAQFHGST